MDYKTFDNLPPILQRLKLKGYKVFDNEDHDLNLIGIRSQNRIAGEYDDLFYCVNIEEGQWVQEVYQAFVIPVPSNISIRQTPKVWPYSRRASIVVCGSLKA